MKGETSGCLPADIFVFSVCTGAFNFHVQVDLDVDQLAYEAPRSLFSSQFLIRDRSFSFLSFSLELFSHLCFQPDERRDNTWLQAGTKEETVLGCWPGRAPDLRLAGSLLTIEFLQLGLN